MDKPKIVKQIEEIIGKELVLAPIYPDVMTGVMIVKEGQVKYALEDNKLTGLNLANIALSDDQWKAIEKEIEPKHLKALNLNSNQLTSITISESFLNLTHLEIADNKLLREIEFEKGLPKLKQLVLRDNNLVKVNLSYGFDALKQLDFSRNKIDKVYFYGTLPKLFFIDSSNNQIKNIEVKSLDNMPELEYWYLNDNPLNQSLLVHHEESHGNNYTPAFKRLRTEFGDKEGVSNDEYKVIIVGDGTAGKTCIVNRLLHDEFKEEDSTHGINIKKFNDPKKIYSFPYILNLWDFGGQDIYHATHRLFLQSDAIYLLAWNKRTEKEMNSKAKSGKKWKEYKNRKLAYWMRYINAYGKRSPVIIAQTSKEKYPNYIHPERGTLTDKYEPLLAYLQFVNIDSKPDDEDENGYEEMMSYLKRGIKKLGRKEKLPPQWVAIKNYLEEKTPTSQYKSRGQFLEADDATLNYDDYAAKAQELGIDDPKKILTNWLVPIGTVFFRAGYFKDKIILNQEWAIRAIYILFERNDELGYYQEIVDNDGQFTGVQLRIYWEGYGEKEQELFIEFMLACGMCYEIKKEQEESKAFEERVFIAPEMLGEKRPKAFIRQEKIWDDKNDNYLRMRYDYDFAYYNYFQQFLVQTQADTQEMIEAYRYGVLIYDSDVHAIIEFDEQRKCIHIKVSENGKILLDRIRNRFKGIHSDKVITFVGRGNYPMKSLATLEILNQKGLQSSTLLEAENNEIAEANLYLPFVQLNENATFDKPVLTQVGTKIVQETNVDTIYLAEQASLHQQAELLIAKLDRLKKALITETDPSSKFKYEHQINDSEQQLQEIKDKIKS